MNGPTLPRFNRNATEAKSVYMGTDIRGITDMVENALVSIDELLGHPDFGGSRDKLMQDLKKILSSQRVSLSRVTFPLGNSTIPDMSFSLDMRKKNISVQSNKWPKKRSLLNSVLRTF